MADFSRITKLLDAGDPASICVLTGTQVREGMVMTNSATDQPINLDGFTATARGEWRWALWTSDDELEPHGIGDAIDPPLALSLIHI